MPYRPALGGVYIKAQILDCCHTYATREKRYSDEQTSAFITLLHILVDNIKCELIIQIDNFLSGVQCIMLNVHAYALQY